MFPIHPLCRARTGPPGVPSGFALVALLLLVLADPRAAIAQIGGPYDLSWNVIDGGGGTTAGGVLSLFASAGQPIAGTAGGGVYSLIGGFDVPLPAGQMSVDDLEGSPEGIPLPLAIHLASPNPTSGPSTIAYDLPMVAEFDLAVYDVAGRLVRQFEPAPSAPGRHVLAWDGKDSGGLPVATGLYFVRLHTNVGQRIEKLVVLR